MGTNEAHDRALAENDYYDRYTKFMTAADEEE
jgi:hypothetical protein